jgi:hypothetical protein
MAEEIDRRASFYYNVNTGQVERWGQSPETDLLGPFATAEEAANALEIIRLREERKEAEDRAWREDGSR